VAVAPYGCQGCRPAVAEVLYTWPLLDGWVIDLMLRRNQESIANIQLDMRIVPDHVGIDYTSNRNKVEIQESRVVG
jgi:hypothetical protein